MKTADGTITYREFLDSEYFEHMMERNVDGYRRRFSKIIQKLEIEDAKLSDTEALGKIYFTFSFNWAAFLFGEFWGVYRRLVLAWAMCALYAFVILADAVDIPGMEKLSYKFGGIGWMVITSYFFGFYGDSWLLSNCVERINKTKSLIARRRVSYLAPIWMMILYLISAYGAVLIEENASIIIPELVDMSDDARVQLVKSGSLNECSSVTVEQAVNSFMGAPSWEAFLADDGQNYVNIEGDIMYTNKDVRATVQLFTDVNAGSFEFRSMEFNGVPQTILLANQLIQEMCDSAISEWHQIKDDVKTSERSEHARNNPVTTRETEVNSSHHQGHTLARSKKHGLEVVASEENGVWCNEEIQLYFNAEDIEFFSNNVFSMTKTIGNKVLPNDCPAANIINIQGFVFGSNVIVFEGVASKQNSWSITQ